MIKRLVFSAVLLAAPSAIGQQTAAQPSAGSNWQHVEVLPVGTALYINSGGHTANCTLKRVDADTLTCLHGGELIYQRSQVNSVKLVHRVRSAVVGTAIGAGVGALIGGLAFGRGCSTPGCYQIVPRGYFAMAGSVTGGPIGTRIGYHTDMTRSTVYQAR